MNSRESLLLESNGNEMPFDTQLQIGSRQKPADPTVPRTTLEIQITTDDELFPLSSDADDIPSLLSDNSSQHLPSELRSLLHSMPFFNYVEQSGEKFLNDVSKHLRIRKYSPSDVVIKQGDPARAVFFVLKGLVNVTTEGGETIIAELGAGSYCNSVNAVGEIALLYDIKRVATVAAKTYCTIAVLSSSDFKHALLMYPQVEASMRSSAKSRIREVQEECHKIGKQAFTYSAILADSDETNTATRSSLRLSEVAAASSGSNPSLSIGTSPTKRASQMHLSDITVDAISPLSSTMLSPAASSPSYASSIAPPHIRGQGERKLSIAPWTDNKLMQFLQGAKGQKEPRFAKKSVEIIAKSTDSLAQSPAQSSRSSPFVSTVSIDTAPPFLQLSDKLLAGSLRRLDIKSLLRLRRVCTHLQSVLKNKKNGLFETIDLSAWHKTVTNDVLASILEFTCGAGVKTLNLQKCWQITDIGLSYIGANVQELVALNLHSAWDITDEGLLNLAQSCQNLQSLDLSNCRKITSIGVSSILNTARYLNSIGLSYCKSLNDEMMTNSQWANLVSINFQRCTGITDNGFCAWSENRAAPLDSPNGHQISIAPIPRQSLQPFALLELDLSDCTFLTDLSIAVISKKCRLLQRVNLSFCCSLSPNAIDSFAANCTSVQVLDMSYCGNAVTDDSLQVIATKYPSIRALGIRGCIQATERGIQFLAESAPTLEKINMTQCKNINMKMVEHLSKWQRVTCSVFEANK